MASTYLEAHVCVSQNYRGISSAWVWKAFLIGKRSIGVTPDRAVPVAPLGIRSGGRSWPLRGHGMNKTYAVGEVDGVVWVEV